jgi:hypothetical protein
VWWREQTGGGRERARSSRVMASQLVKKQEEFLRISEVVQVARWIQVEERFPGALLSSAQSLLSPKFRSIKG